jgi:glycogen debranching enzyme
MQRSTAVGAEEVGRCLEIAENRYANTRVEVDGHWCGLAESITNNLNWMTALKPEDGSRYTPAGRRWIFPRSGGGRDHWTVFCWDAFFNALELAVESPDLAGDTLRAVLESQYENGNIPNWRGRFFGTRDRSQPPIGSFVVLKMFLRSGDRSVLEKSFPALERWSAWWRAPKANCLRRDGNGNGLFEWGCDLDLREHSPAPWENEASPHQFAAWESGQDDLPNWDDAKWVAETGTLDLESVDLNSLLALDFYCLRRIAELLDLADKATAYGRLYESLAEAMNEHLWDEDRGMYVDRFWDGRLSKRLAASNFYPLVAGIAPADRAERMLDTLVNTKKFWGRFVLPSISRDDPAFNDQQYWRGTIWPPTNYLVYQGLKRYHFDEVAAALAERSVELFLGSWRRDRVCRENYDSRTGEGGGQKYQSWGPLFALTGIEEFIDVTPWDGLRIGTLFPPPSTVLDRIRIGGRDWRVALSRSGLSISVDGKELLVFTRPVVLRQFELDCGRIGAKVHAHNPCTGIVSLGTEAVTMTLDGENAICPASAVQIPAGEHSMSIMRTP